MAKSGKSAKQKGSRAERDVRDHLKRIYSSDKRSRINRVPMSGAGWMKGDVIDMNNTDYSYEVKNQEKLALPEWWRQTLNQTHSSQQPVLVFTSNYRPLYWVIKKADYEYLAGETGRLELYKLINLTTRSIYKKLSELDRLELGLLNLVDDEVVVIDTEKYIEMRKDLYESRS